MVIYTEGLRHRIVANIDQTRRVVLTNKCWRHRGSNPRHQIGSLESYHTTKRPSTWLCAKIFFVASRLVVLASSLEWGEWVRDSSSLEFWTRTLTQTRPYFEFIVNSWLELTRIQLISNKLADWLNSMNLTRVRLEFVKNYALDEFCWAYWYILPQRSIGLSSTSRISLLLGLRGVSITGHTQNRSGYAKPVTLPG